MSQHHAAAIAQDYLNPNKIKSLLKLSISITAHNHTGKIYEDLPDMFLVKPEALMVKELGYTQLG
jgi:hypothetical protein